MKSLHSLVFFSCWRMFFWQFPGFYLIWNYFIPLNLIFIHSGVFSASSPALSVTSAVLATIVIATTKYRLEVTDDRLQAIVKCDPVCQAARAAAVASVCPGGGVRHPGHVLAAPGAAHPPPLPHGVSGPGIPIIANVIVRGRWKACTLRYMKNLNFYKTQSHVILSYSMFSIRPKLQSLKLNRTVG